MLSKPILKVKLPYADKRMPIEDAFNYAIKSLNSSFTKEMEPVSEIAALGEIINLPFTSATNVYFNTIPLDHNLGVVPSGYVIIECIHPMDNGNAQNTFTFVSSTSTTITIRIGVATGGASLASGSFKILVLR